MLPKTPDAPMTLLRNTLLLFFALATLAPGTVNAQTEGESPTVTSQLLDGLELRSIGPAVRSGRISDVGIDPTDQSTWYVAAASGNVWKTKNAGTTWTPIFDQYGSYSIGTVTVDPNNPQVLWLGTGENNSQRSVSYGDGVYKSTDGGKTWANTGLKASNHVGNIVVDPRDSDVVYVAAQGPLWSPGGNRGLYKTTDGGETWERVLHVGENTGISDVAVDPERPDILYATSYQRRRHVGILVAGGLESRIYKSTDGGETWRKIMNGIPGGPLGRIGVAVSPIKPNVLYATVAASRDRDGFFRSDDRGESWEKQSDYVSIDPQYYQEIFPDPHTFDRVYVMDIWMQVSHDGGKTFEPVPSDHKHVDNHALAFDPDDPSYLLSGNDGGLYQSWDDGETWKFVSNLPVTQFYRVAVDHAEPFYNVYGGTQDNGTLGGPSQTGTEHGIRNSDWTHINGGDGFGVDIDPENPNIVYAMSQYGELVRYDKKTGESVNIQPQPPADGDALRWHWNSPLQISPHSNTRLYYAANRLFRSNDRGHSWTPIGPDLTREIDRNERTVMGRVWSPDAVRKNVYTSPYGTIVSMDVSPLQEDLIYAGTDDGLLQITEDGGETWRTINSFPGVPDTTYVVDVVASRHDPSTVFALFNNHKEGDYQPYVLKSTDRGQNWTSLSSTLPDDEPVWSLAQDHEDEDLLFLGAEFGVYTSLDGGEQWIELTGNVPTIQFRDVTIQRREDDLVGATFGRGFYVLDNYAPLRELAGELLDREAHLFSVKDADGYIQTDPLGGGEKGSRGHAFYTAPNPSFGATFTYYLRDELTTKREERLARERELRRRGESVSFPAWDSLRAEEREESPAVVLEVQNDNGEVVRRVEGPHTSGLHRRAWDLRYPSFEPVETGENESGPMVTPGTYTAHLLKREDGQFQPLGEPRSFEVTPLQEPTLPPADRDARLAFQTKVARLQRAVLATNRVAERTAEQLDHIKQAVQNGPDVSLDLYERTRTLERRLADLRVQLTGNTVKEEYNEPTPPAVIDRVQRVVGAFWSTTSTPTETHRRDYRIASDEFSTLLAQLRTLIEEDLRALEQQLEDAQVPWTEGRGLPTWQPE